MSSTQYVRVYRGLRKNKQVDQGGQIGSASLRRWHLAKSLKKNEGFGFVDVWVIRVVGKDDNWY